MNNDEPLLIVLVLVVPAIIAIVVGYAIHHHQRQAENYRKLAQRLRGKFREGSLFEAPEVTFHHGGTWGRVDVQLTGGKHKISHTRVRIAWADARVRCEVFPAQIFHRFGKLLGMADLEIGVPEFDHDYIISGGNAEPVREMLTADVRAIINRVRAQADFGDMYFSVSGGELLLRRRGVFTTVAEMEQFVRTAMKLYDNLSGGMKGIEFIDEVHVDEPATATTATCQVCGEAIAADPVLCNACRTSHHHDCWEYYGQCSTFGCRERGFHRPRRQAAAKGRK